MGSHTVTCHPTQVSRAHTALTPAIQAGVKLLVVISALFWLLPFCKILWFFSGYYILLTLQRFLRDCDRD